MSIAFEELEGSPTIKIDPRGTTAQRVFRVAWDDWPRFVSALVGSYRRVGCRFHFVAPLEFPGLTGVVATSVDVAPLDPLNPHGGAVESLRSGTNRYPAAGARVTVDYETLAEVQPARGDLPGVPEGTYLTYRAQLGSEFLTVPPRGWFWDAPPENPPLPADINPGIVIPTGTLRLTWHRVAMPNFAAISQLRGRVNAAPFVGGAAGTVLFVGAIIERQFQFSDDGGFWRVEFVFSERAIELTGGGWGGWNHLYKEEAVDAQHWLKVSDEAGNHLYAEADFGSLFTFGGC